MTAYATQMPEPTGALTLTRDEVMTAREVADLLRMPVSTVYELARRGELPARRLGRTCASFGRGWRRCSPADRPNGQAAAGSTSAGAS